MTKKHFIEIAAILNKEECPSWICEALASYFKSINPNFNREKFLDACLGTPKT